MRVLVCHSCNNPKLTLTFRYFRMLADRSVVEAFVQGGRRSFTRSFCTDFPGNMDKMNLHVFNKGETEKFFVHEVSLYKMTTSNIKPQATKVRVLSIEFLTYRSSNWSKFYKSQLES
ncbi:hypothetical protein AAMO2058_000380900 [Amorphochlora amoebiformis]